MQPLLVLIAHPEGLAEEVRAGQGVRAAATSEVTSGPSRSATAICRIPTLLPGGSRVPTCTIDPAPSRDPLPTWAPWKTITAVAR
jgi:hypothetical protein